MKVRPLGGRRNLDWKYLIVAQLLIQAAQNAEQVKLANALMANGHHGDHRAALRWMETCGMGAPDAIPQHTRIALWNGTLAAALRITTGAIRIGEARFRLGGLGWLTTSPRHRHKGIGRALLADTLAYLRDQNYHVSMLFGVPNFYRRFGFETVLGEYAWEIPVEAVSRPRMQHRIRAGKPGDIGAVIRLHEQNDGAIACSWIRSAAHITHRWEQWKGLQVLTDDQGRVRGYFVPARAENPPSVLEAGSAGADVCASILHVCAQQAREHFSSRLRFLGPPECGFARTAAQVVGHETLRTVRQPGGMMSFVNLSEALESAIPEWESRIFGTPLHPADEELTLVVARRPYRIHAHRGAIDVLPGSGKNKVSLGEGALLKLLTGSVAPDTILDDARRMLTPEARALFCTLFPPRSPYVWPLDRF
jgi:predicted N-acetyltransferase YhbS